MRSYWHPYTDDTPPARVCLDHCVGTLDLIDAIPGLIDHIDTPGVGWLYRCFRHRNPYHNPTFGCLVFEN